MTDTSPHDVIFVLAGGINEEGVSHDWVIGRLDLALKYYRERPAPIVVLGGGTYHKPPHVDGKGFVTHECSSGANYLASQGVPFEMIRKEWSSYDTIGNVYFSLLNHVWPMQYRKVLVITSEFHMPRAKLLFSWIYGQLDQQHEYQLTFDAAKDVGMEDSVLEKRRAKEQSSCMSVKRNLLPRISSLEQFYHWFYTEHRAYSATNRNIEILDGELLQTY